MLLTKKLLLIISIFIIYLIVMITIIIQRYSDNDPQTEEHPVQEEVKPEVKLVPPIGVEIVASIRDAKNIDYKEPQCQGCYGSVTISTENSGIIIVYPIRAGVHQILNPVFICQKLGEQTYFFLTENDLTQK